MDASGAVQMDARVAWAVYGSNIRSAEQGDITGRQTCICSQLWSLHAINSPEIASVAMGMYVMLHRTSQTIVMFSSGIRLELADLKA